MGKQAKKVMGRPRKWDDPDKLLEAGMQYFEEDDKPTLSGLALHLGFCDRFSLYDYEKNENFSHAIKALRAKLTNIIARRALYHEGGQVTGAVFYLKNLGYSDRQVTAIEGGDPEKPVKVEHSVDPDNVADTYNELIKRSQG